MSLKSTWSKSSIQNACKHTNAFNKNELVHIMVGLTVFLSKQLWVVQEQTKYKSCYMCYFCHLELLDLGQG